MVNINAKSLQDLSGSESVRRAPAKSSTEAPQDDYTNHIKQFRAAKVFRTPTTVETTVETTVQTTTPTTPTTVVTQWTEHPKTFGSKTEVISDKKEGEENKVDDRDLFEALQVEKPDICGSCPPIWMKNNAEIKDLCTNHESVSTFFSMTMDRRDAKNITDESDIKECTRTITCSQPHMLVKWHESDLCDVHAPSAAGDLVTDSNNTFVYKCNGTHWFMHGFPLSSVVCAVSSK